MSKSQSFLFALFAIIMVVAAWQLGSWSEQINPDGIAPHPAVDGNPDATPSAPRDAFSFGVSMGLLAAAMAYCCIAFGLMIGAKAKGRTVSRFTYWLAGLAGLGFALSYLIDDFFY